QPQPADPVGHVPEGGRPMSAPGERRALSPRVYGLIQNGLLVLMALISLVPLLAIFVGTFQNGNEIIRQGVTLDIDWGALTFDNYRMLFTDSGYYFRWFANTLGLTIVRSEERRVGKECRSGWSAKHEKRK